MRAEPGDCSRQGFTNDLTCLRCGVSGELSTYEQLDPTMYVHSAVPGGVVPFYGTRRREEREAEPHTACAA